MPYSFNCPNCSAPLDVEGDGSATLRCPYCNTSVIIPQELRIQTQDARISTPSQNTYNTRPDIDLIERMDTIRKKALEGDEIEAIRLIRETFVIGLLDAKGLVEAIQRGEQIDLRDLPLVSPTSLNSTSLDSATMERLMLLINSGDKIEAIKLFRASTDAGLKDAKDAVDGIEAAMSAPHVEFISQADPVYSQLLNSQSPGMPAEKSRGGRNCLVPVFLVFILLVTVVPILAAMTTRGGLLTGTWARINPFAVGNLTLQFGEEGTGPGYFTDARFVSVDNNGHIFVGETTGGRVQVFDEAGNYLTQWKASGEETGDIYLTGMAADRNGAVYSVVGSILYIYDGLNGNLLGMFEHPDGWGFEDVTVAPDGAILGAWYKNRDDLVRFDHNGNIDLWVENAIGSVTTDSEMDSHVAVDGTGNIYALAYFNGGVFVFSEVGKYVSRFGSFGDEDGQFTSPRAIAVDNFGKIYISDFPGVMIFASDGRYLDTLPVDGAVMGLAFDDQNNLYLVADEQVMRYKLK